MSETRRRRSRSVSVCKRKQADGQLGYAIRWRDRTGRRRCEKVDGGLKDARQRAADKEKEVNGYGEISEISWEGFVKEHLEAIRADVTAGARSENYYADHKRTLDRFRNSATVYLSDLRVADVEGFYRVRLQTGLSISSANRELRTLKAVLSHALKLNYLAANPAKGVSIVKAALSPRRVLSRDEWEKLLAACSDNYSKALVHVTLTTGMRRAELLNLQWQDVDLSTGRVEVVSRDGFKTKSRKNRITSTDIEGCRLLAWIRERHPEAKRVFMDTGGRLTRGKVEKGLKKLCKAAGIPRCGLHDLRRTSLTMLACKLPAFALQQRAGHVSPSTTADYYLGSLAEESNRLAGEVFGKVFGPSGRKVDADNSGA